MTNYSFTSKTEYRIFPHSITVVCNEKILDEKAWNYILLQNRVTSTIKILSTTYIQDNTCLHWFPSPQVLTAIILASSEGEKFLNQPDQNDDKMHINIFYMLNKSQKLKWDEKDDTHKRRVYKNCERVLSTSWQKLHPLSITHILLLITLYQWWQEYGNRTEKTKLNQERHKKHQQ